MKRAWVAAVVAVLALVPSASARSIEPANEENGGGGYFYCTEVPPGYLIFWNGSDWVWTGKFC